MRTLATLALLLALPVRAEVVLTAPHCDVCTAEDKAWLQARSPTTQRIVALIDGARATVDAAQFTFSVRPIEEALLRAHARGIKVRLALDAGQQGADTAGARLAAAGVPVRFVTGQTRGQGAGLQHAKYLLVDARALAAGSGNWSSTGTTINDESLIIQEAEGDPLIRAFLCHFSRIWDQQPEKAGACGLPDRVAFSPSTAPITLITRAIQGAKTSIDVLMHHLLFDKLMKELVRARARGVRVRIVVNAADRDETRGPRWDHLRGAGVEIRYKRGNAGLYQLSHHKLAIVDGRTLLHGSGNWSGSAFFNNYEFFVRHDDPSLVAPFRARFEQLWALGLTAESVDAGLDPARQAAAATRIFFGNLHAHFSAGQGDARWDDGRPERHGPDGVVVPVDVPADAEAAARQAFAYARDEGHLDFLALTPHVVDDAPGDPADVPDMAPAGFAALRAAAAASTEAGRFVALAGMEWNTNSRGNHVNVFGSQALAKVPRGRFDQLYDAWLPGRAAAGDRVWIMLNHPRTFRRHDESVEGAWDQAFDVPLPSIPKGGERAQKFNDYGIDDYPPLAAVLPDWISGDARPDPAVVAKSLAAVERASRPFARLMEVTVGRGTELGGETPANPSLVPGADGALTRQTHVQPDWEYYLSAGFRLAPAASHDNHFANWGTGHTSRTAIIAAALTPDALDAAIAARAVYASEDQNLALRFHADGRVAMGGQVTTAAAALPATVMVDDPDFPGPFTLTLRRGEVGGTFETVWTTTVGAGWHDLNLPLTAPGRTTIFYVQVHEPGPDRMAWSAPIWVERL